jgi:maltooligosyltrehalose trehalohydrolase
MASSATVTAKAGQPSGVRRRLPVGADYQGAGKTHVRVWAPAVDRVAVVVDDARAFDLEHEGGGYFSGVIAASPGSRYQFRLGPPENVEKLYPDPASRFQPEGPHGPSEIIDPSAFSWTDAGWTGATLPGQVIYELHIGTFTPEGTFESAARQLPELARLGVTLVEVMPVAEFDGRFGWGYDGVDLYAPFHLYGRPDDLRRFVDAAHAEGIGVLLDVVYNHLGPVGNYLRAFAPAYFSDRYENEWGDAINFDGPDSGPVRELFASNAAYWIDEFHLDGLRLDATQQIFDESEDHIVAVIGRRAREAAGARPIVIVAENEPQDTRLVRPLSAGGFGLDGLWNDDLHHSAMVALTGRGEAYYTDTRGGPQELISAAKYGYLFQGQHYSWQRHPRGRPAWDVPPSAFVTFLQNHDQVANSARGLRGDRLSSPGRWRALTAYLLLAPGTPMLFQGQEIQSSAPFLYFADFGGDLGAAIRNGRREFLRQFPSLVGFLQHNAIDDPADPSTFERCKLDWREREIHAGAYALHRDLLRLRRETAAFRSANAAGPDPRAPIDGCVLSSQAFALRYFTPDHADDRLLVVNLGADVIRSSFAEPLLAPPDDCDWVVEWSSEEASYGGLGTAFPWPDHHWCVAGDSAFVAAPGPRREQAPRMKRRTA